MVNMIYTSHLTPHTSHLTPHTSHLTPWLTDKSFCDRLTRPALKVRANSSKSSKEDCEGLATRFNGFHSISPDFNHGRVSNAAISLSRLLSVNQPHTSYSRTQDPRLLREVGDLNGSPTSLNVVSFLENKPG